MNDFFEEYDRGERGRTLGERLEGHGFDSRRHHLPKLSPHLHSPASRPHDSGVVRERLSEPTAFIPRCHSVEIGLEWPISGVCLPKRGAKVTPFVGGKSEVIDESRFRARDSVPRVGNVCVSPVDNAGDRTTFVDQHVSGKVITVGEYWLCGFLGGAPERLEAVHHATNAPKALHYLPAVRLTQQDVGSVTCEPTRFDHGRVPRVLPEVSPRIRDDSPTNVELEDVVGPIQVRTLEANPKLARREPEGRSCRRRDGRRAARRRHRSRRSLPEFADSLRWRPAHWLDNENRTVRNETLSLEPVRMPVRSAALP